MRDIITEEVVYKNFGICVKMSNSEIELYITIDKGPRIIRYGFIDGENQFCEDIPTTMEVLGDTWSLMGGHRLWHSPENNPRTYIPDNKPVKWSKNGNSITLEMEEEPWTQVKKEMEIHLKGEGTEVEILHKLTNNNAWTIELSAWAITVMASGGVEVIPQPKRETNLLPNRVISLWPYSKMNDERIYWGDKYILLKQNRSKKHPFKLGIANEEGWAAYFNHNSLFIKKYKHILEENYPDFGASYETYTNEYMVEMETLSPLKKLLPGESITHAEKWQLIGDVFYPGEEEDKIENIFKTKGI
ncbi:DUF4380 domain-containing protein [Clostridium sp. MSJ-11]|uniref:DUF4380 domain-containing protein n=1 Tax=Clostridium mobile TaxID=2841512 RepID=A0ABS6EGN7_9CLOT|nr:DUF4380 domain-containing protein [Clostridium mobile]MBU5483579.1 DUF4380 domain-containing protein [Clostridium mobile]